MSTVLQILQWLPSVFPAVSQVAATAASFTSLWPVAAIVSVLVFWQRLQVYVFVPVSVQVAAFVTFPSSQL